MRFSFRFVCRLCALHCVVCMAGICCGSYTLILRWASPIWGSSWANVPFVCQKAVWVQPFQEGANLWKGILSYILQCFLCCWPQMTRPPLQVTLYFLWLRVCVCVCERMCEGISRLRRSISEWNILSWLWHWLFSCSLLTSQSLTFISPFHLSVHSVCVCLCVLVTRACGCVVCTCQNAHIGNQYSFTSVEKLNY